MINTAAKHDQPDPLSAFQVLMQTQVTDDSARQITGYLDERVGAAKVISDSDHISLIMLTRCVVEGCTKFAFGMVEGDYLA